MRVNNVNCKVFKINKLYLATTIATTTTTMITTTTTIYTSTNTISNNTTTASILKIIIFLLKVSFNEHKIFKIIQNINFHYTRYCPDTDRLSKLFDMSFYRFRVLTALFWVLILTPVTNMGYWYYCQLK